MPLQKGPGPESMATLSVPPPAPWLFDPWNWKPAGRGRDFQFFATDEDIVELFAEALPEEYGPYSLLVPYVEPHSNAYREVVSRYSMLEFIHQREEGQELFQIQSHAITGNVDFSGAQKLRALIGVNGLLYLHHGNRSNKLGWLPSHLGIVHRIVQQFTGERHEHCEYDRIFGCLKRAAQERLKYKTLSARPDARPRAYPVPMTERFKQAVERGEIATVYRPGDPL